MTKQEWKMAYAALRRAVRKGRAYSAPAEARRCIQSRERSRNDWRWSTFRSALSERPREASGGAGGFGPLEPASR